MTTPKKISIYSEPSVRTDTHRVTIDHGDVTVDGHRLDMVGGYTISHDTYGALPEVTLELACTTQFTGPSHTAICEESANALAALGWAEPITDADRLDDLARHADETVSGCLIAALPDGQTFTSTLVEGEIRWYRRGAALTEHRETSVMLLAANEASGGPVRVWLP